MTSSVVLGEASGMFNVNFFVDFAVEKSCLDIYLFNFSVVNGGKQEDGLI